MTQVLDSASAIDYAAAKAAGYKGAIRYLSSFPAKNLSPEEHAKAHEAGLPVALVYEDGNNDFAGGANAGVAKAHVAAPILVALKWGKDRPVYCAVDNDLPVSQYEISWEGIDTFAKALDRPAGAYAPRPFLCYLEARGVKFLWELASSSFNTGPEPRTRSLQQLVDQVSPGGVTCDVNNVLADDWGQFPAPAKPKPKPPVSALIRVDLPSFREGDSGQAVRSLQVLLGIKADGVYGPSTLAAVLAFKRAHHLPEDGIVGGGVYAHLFPRIP